MIIFKKRILDPGVPAQYQDLITSQRVTQIYIDELTTTDQSIGVGVVRLVVESPQEVMSSARFLLNKARQEVVDVLVQQQIVELIETIVLYKFPQMTRQEIEAVFGFQELKQTRYFQDVAQEAREEGKREGRQEGKVEVIPRLIALGLTVEQIAEALELSVEQVQQIVAANDSN